MSIHLFVQIQKDKRNCLGFRLSCKNVNLEVCEEESESADFLEGICEESVYGYAYKKLKLRFSEQNCCWPNALVGRNIAVTCLYR